MDDYISREAAIFFCEEFANQAEEHAKGFYNESRGFAGDIWQTASEEARLIGDGIKQLPAADVATVRRGRWVESKRVPVFNSNCESVYWKCSECGIEICTTLPEYELGKWHYCVNCGAKMEGEP